jgi:hypothetical protein
MLWLVGPVRIYGIWRIRFAVMLKGCRDCRPFSISLYAIDGWTAVLLHTTETISITETIAPVQTTDSQVHTVITGTLSREIPLNGRNPLHPELPFVELAGFHDEPHALESCDIRQGIAVDRDEIRFKPRRDGADQVLQIH